MHLLDLPVDIVSAVVDLLVLSCTLREGLYLRHVNHFFDCEILRAYFTSGIVDFHADAPDAKSSYCSWQAMEARKLLPNYQAKRMSKIHAVRLLHGRLDALHKYGSDLPWLYKLEAAARLLQTTSRTSPLAISPVILLEEDAAHRDTMQQICALVVDYLGVSQVIESLDATRQYLCCTNHYLPDVGIDRSKPSFEPAKHFRRPESTLDWAILTAMYTRDFAAVPSLLKSQCFNLGPNPELPASLRCSTGRDRGTVFRLLLGAGVGVDGLGHATRGDSWNESDWNFGSALEAACAAGSMRIVGVCLSPDYNLNLPGFINESAMIIAASLDNHQIALKIVKFLLSRLNSWDDLSGATRVIFTNTCQNGNVDLAKLIFENAPYKLNGCYNSDSCVLRMAVEHGHANMVMYILSQLRSCMDRFPHYEASRWRGIRLRRAMRHAARFGRVHIASLLWAELGSSSMLNLLSDAATFGHVSMIEFLLSKGLDLSEEYSANGYPKTIGEHALILAVEHAHESATGFLLGLGICIVNLPPFSPSGKEDPAHAPRSEEGVQNLLLAYGLGLVPNKGK